MSIRTKMILVAAVATMASGGILTATADAATHTGPARAGCTNPGGHGQSPEGTSVRSKTLTLKCTHGKWISVRN